MIPDSLKIVTQFREVFHEFYWIAVPLVLLTFLRSFIEEFIAGVLWRFKSGYDNYEVVEIEDEYARIMHMGLFRTEFNVYLIKDNKVVGGSVMSVLNSELRKMKIKQPLALLDIPEELRKIVK